MSTSTSVHPAASEQEIIKKVIMGEVTLFEVLVRRTNPGLYKIARNYGFNHQDAEDLMQETHVAAYQHLGQFGGRSSYKTWVSKIMIHKCLYQLQHGRGRKEQPASDTIPENAQPMLQKQPIPDPAQAAMNKEFTAVLEHALQRLPVTYRTVFLLREVEGFSVAETAEMLNITQVNVKVRLNRSKTILQKELEQYYASSNIYDFNLIYCDALVKRVFDIIQPK